MSVQYHQINAPRDRVLPRKVTFHIRIFLGIPDCSCNTKNTNIHHLRWQLPWRGRQILTVLWFLMASTISGRGQTTHTLTQKNPMQTAYSLQSMSLSSWLSSSTTAPLSIHFSLKTHKQSLPGASHCNRQLVSIKLDHRCLSKIQNRPPPCMLLLLTPN